MTAGAMTPSMTPGAHTPGGGTPGNFTPGGATPSGFTPGGITPSGVTPIGNKAMQMATPTPGNHNCMISIYYKMSFAAFGEWPKYASLFNFV